MDDGWEMSDGVQAKVPIRGQPEGGVSPTGANGRRLGETAAVATAQPRLPNPDHRRCGVTALLCISFPHIRGSRFPVLFEIGIASGVFVLILCDCKRSQKVLMCSRP